LPKGPQRRVLQLNVIEVLHGLDEKGHDRVKVLHSLGATLRGQLPDHSHDAAGERHVVAVLAHLGVQAVEQGLHVQRDEAGRVREQMTCGFVTCILVIRTGIEISVIIY